MISNENTWQKPSRWTTMYFECPLTSLGRPKTSIWNSKGRKLLRTSTWAIYKTIIKAHRILHDPFILSFHEFFEGPSYYQEQSQNAKVWHIFMKLIIRTKEVIAVKMMLGMPTSHRMTRFESQFSSQFQFHAWVYSGRQLVSPWNS